IVIVTHDLDFVSDISTRIIVMNRGQVMAQGDPKDILYEEDLLKEANLMPPSIVKLAKGLGLNDRILSFEEMLQKIDNLLLRNV
ncbi:MAG TPA: hypothetical protein VKU94_02020, partial [Geobacterales bacterium]|nr:hypothetical protein [Geobacterales bacterium]